MRQTSRPLRTGRFRSRMMRSGGAVGDRLQRGVARSRRSRASASPPRSSVCLMRPAMSCSSSTMRTRCLAMKRCGSVPAAGVRRCPAVKCGLTDRRVEPGRTVVILPLTRQFHGVERKEYSCVRRVPGRPGFSSVCSPRRVAHRVAQLRRRSSLPFSTTRRTSSRATGSRAASATASTPSASTTTSSTASASSRSTWARAASSRSSRTSRTRIATTTRPTTC